MGHLEGHVTERRGDGGIPPGKVSSSERDQRDNYKSLQGRRVEFICGMSWANVSAAMLSLFRDMRRAQREDEGRLIMVNVLFNEHSLIDLNPAHFHMTLRKHFDTN